MKRLYLAALMMMVILMGRDDKSFAQGSIIRRGAEAIVEAIGKKGAKELVEFGGETAVREVLQQAEKEGGEALLSKVIQYGEKYGVAALEGMKRSPRVFVQCLDELPGDVALKALQAVKREPDLMAKLVTEYGTDALRIAAKHPGVGEQITKTLGREGIDLAQRVSTQSAVKLSRLAEPIARLPESQKAQVLGVLKDAPVKLLDFLEKHPKVLLTSAGVASFVAAKEQILGGYEVITDADGTVRVLGKPGFMERIWRATAEEFKTPISSLIWILALILLAWGVVKIWGVVRLERAKVRVKEAKLRLEEKQAAKKG